MKTQLLKTIGWLFSCAGLISYKDYENFKINLMFIEVGKNTK